MTNTIARLMRAIGFVSQRFSAPLTPSGYELGLGHPSGVHALRREQLGEPGWHVSDGHGRHIFVGDTACDQSHEQYSVDGLLADFGEIWRIVDEAKVTGA